MAKPISSSGVCNMRKLAFKLTGHAAAVGLISGFIMATLVAAGPAGAADLSAGDGEGDRAIYVCGHRMDHIILFDEDGRPTVPARTPMYYCITGQTLTASQLPPPPEYCCH